MSVRLPRSVRIRRAGAGDVESLLEIRTSVRENYRWEELAGVGVTRDAVSRMLRTSSRAWIAEEHGEAVGFSMADGETGSIVALFVRPGQEGRGMGRALLERAERWLVSRGAREIWLLTGSAPELRANGFYRHLGWSPSGEQEGQLRFVKVLSAARLLRHRVAVAALVVGTIGALFGLAVISMADCVGPHCTGERILGVAGHAAAGALIGGLLGSLHHLARG